MFFVRDRSPHGPPGSAPPGATTSAAQTSAQAGHPGIRRQSGVRRCSWSPDGHGSPVSPRLVKSSSRARSIHAGRSSEARSAAAGLAGHAIQRIVPVISSPPHQMQAGCPRPHIPPSIIPCRAKPRQEGLERIWKSPTDSGARGPRPESPAPWRTMAAPGRLRSPKGSKHPPRTTKSDRRAPPKP